MSYVITIKANAGTTAVTVEGDLPDGEHIIRGEDDGNTVSTEVERRSELGRYVNRARSHYSRAELDQALNHPRSIHGSAPDDADS
jgi:hypothetical protein